MKLKFYLKWFNLILLSNITSQEYFQYQKIQIKCVVIVSWFAQKESMVFEETISDVPLAMFSTGTFYLKYDLC